jgi:hypothetical protein
MSCRYNPGSNSGKIGRETETADRPFETPGIKGGHRGPTLSTISQKRLTFLFVYVILGLG